MPLKVLHVLDHSLPLHSGYAFRTLSILREQRKLGWQTIQLTTPKQGRSEADVEFIEGFTFLRTGIPDGSNVLRQMFATARRIREVSDRFSPDLIHAHSPVLTAIPSLYVTRRSTIPVVYEMRATWEDAAVDHGTTTQGSVRYFLSQKAESFVLRHSHSVTTICEGLRGEIVLRGIPQHKVTVIPNAVDIEQFMSRPGETLPEHDQGDSIQLVTVGFIGSFYRYEGLDILLKATSKLVELGVKIKVVLVGGGPEEEKLKGLVHDKGISDVVQFTGRVSHNEVMQYYEKIDVLVYPRQKTRLTELVTPLKPLEAMAQGKLVLASDVGGHRELIRDGVTGVLFRADDDSALVSAVQDLLRVRSSWPRIQEEAKQFVREERNWSGSVAGYRDAYGAALAAVGRNLEEL